MEYAQLNEAGSEAIQITTHGNVEWDANNYCTPAQLTRDGKADQFRVVPLTITEPPTYDPITQSVIRDGCEKVGNEWQYKWRIDDLSPEQIAANQEAIRLASIPRVVTMRQARLALHSAGLLDAVTAAVNAAPQDIKIEWEYATEVDRNWPTLAALTATLGLTELQLDELFTLAGSL